jgi:5-formyltetrahydrofolate cyclo-ligase
MQDWSEIRRWRKTQRAALKSLRLAMPRAARNRADAAIIRVLLEQGPPLHRFAFYWPMHAEVDLRPLASDLVETGAEASLPVVVDRDGPLEFWRWEAGTKLTTRSIWKIPIPVDRVPVHPDVLLIPTLGFDAALFRLGYGGGYYDRTLASMAPKPLAVGVAYEIGRLGSIHPQPHDVPLDAIVTETGFFERAARDSSG